MKYLITGGCGFIGVNLVSYLLRKDPSLKIRILDNLSTGKAENLKEAGILDKVDLIVGDICDYDTCIRACKGVDSVIHLAAQSGVIPSIEDPFTDCKINVIGTLNLLKASLENGVEKFIFASSNAPIGESNPPVNENKIPRPASPYGASKLSCEAYCSAFYHSYGLKTLIFRFSNVYGPYSLHKSSVVAKFIKDAMLKKELTIYGDGNQTRDFIYVDDICQAIWLALGCEKEIWGKPIHLGTGKETRIIDLANFVKSLFNDNIRISFAPERKGEIKKNFSDISKAKEILGFSPSVELKDGVRRVYEWFKTKEIDEIRNAVILSGSE